MSYTDIILAALEVNDTATLLKIANELDTMDGARTADKNTTKRVGSGPR